MNNKNNNYRVMKFLEPINKKEKYKGYVRLDIRGTKGTIIVSVENLGDSKSHSEVYLYKDKKDKIKLGDINNKKGMIKKIITFTGAEAIEEYNVCGVVKESKIVLYADLFNAVNQNDIKKLEVEEISTEEFKFEDENIDSVDENIEFTEKNDENYEIGSGEIYKSDEFESSENETAEYDEIVQNVQYEEIDSPVEAEMNNDNLNHEDETEKAQVEATYNRTKYKNKFEENLYEVLKSYQKINPLSVNIKNLSWWSVPYDDRGIRNGFLPYYNQVISSYYPYPMTNRVTTCNGLMKKYGHYIFGILKGDGEIKKFVYGVPGEFKREEQPYKGITGFKNWSYKNKNDEGNYGYWLAFLDPTTGEVTEPPQIEVSK